MQKLIVKEKLTTLNKYIDAERRNRYLAAKIKKDETEIIYWDCREQKQQAIYDKVDIVFHHYKSNNREDHDNISFIQKFILDGLVSAGILQDDSPKYVWNISHRFYIDKSNPRVEVELIKNEENTIKG